MILVLNDLLRVELLEKARAAHRHGLIVCEACGFAWLTVETARIGIFGGPMCMDEYDCVRRAEMRIGLPRKLRKEERLLA